MPERFRARWRSAGGRLVRQATEAEFAAAEDLGVTRPTRMKPIQVHAALEVEEKAPQEDGTVAERSDKLPEQAEPSPTAPAPEPAKPKRKRAGRKAKAED